MSMAMWRLLVLSVAALQAQDLAEQTRKLRELASASPKLNLKLGEVKIQGPELGFISSVAADGRGTFYLLQRGLVADPVIAIDRTGRILRSWGKGMFKMPHSVRVAPDGSIWTVDAASSLIYKFTPEGKKLLEISVGEQPKRSSEFVGTADIAFAPDGRLFIADGYGNARVLVYSSDGKRLAQWGKPGQGPGDFHLPHGIAIDSDNTVYVADRENGRIQRFDLDGRYLGEFTGLGKTFSVTIAGGNLWIGTQPRNEPNGAPGWLMKLDRKTGKVLGVVDSPGHHSLAVTPQGELLTGLRPDKLLWFRR
jgi:DNA-binding beta-propeller fold protein YncE